MSEPVTEVENDEKRVSLVNLMKATGKTGIKAAKGVFQLIGLIPMITQIAWSILGLASLVIIFVLIVYIILILNPRLPQVFHSEDADTILNRLTDDLVSSIKLLLGGDPNVADGSWMMNHDELKKDYLALKSSLSKFLNDDGTVKWNDPYNNPFNSDLKTCLTKYFIFYNSFVSPSCIRKSDLRNNLPEIEGEDGSPNRIMVVENFVTPMNKFVFEHLIPFSERLHAIGDFLNLKPIRTVKEIEPESKRKSTIVATPAGSIPTRPSKNKRNVSIIETQIETQIEPSVTVHNLRDNHIKYATLIHEVRMMMEQRVELTRMFESRRPNLPMAIWTVYYAPLVVNVFKKRIPAFWMKFPRRYVNTLEILFRFWQRLGALIVALPCFLAYPDPVQRQKQCRSPESFEAFQQGSNVYKTFLGFNSD